MQILYSSIIISSPQILQQGNYSNHKIWKIISIQLCFQACIPEISTEITAVIRMQFLCAHTWADPQRQGLVPCLLLARPHSRRKPPVLLTNFPRFVVIVCLIPGTGCSCKACPRSFRRGSWSLPTQRCLDHYLLFPNVWFAKDQSGRAWRGEGLVSTVCLSLMCEDWQAD